MGNLYVYTSPLVPFFSLIIKLCNQPCGFLPSCLPFPVLNYAQPPPCMSSSTRVQVFIIATMGKGRLPVVMVVVVVMLLAVLVFPTTTEAMLVSFRNDMPGPISVHCYGKDEGDLGLRFVGVGKTYGFTVPGHYFSGKRYSCTFVGTAKPMTTFDVFVGWGGVHNKPCGCLGDVCQWIVSNDKGFSCNNYSYTHPWGN